MSENDTPIEERIEAEVHHLLDFMKDETKYTDEYKSMITQLTKVMELRQKQRESETAQETKMNELAQRQYEQNRDHELKLEELDLKKSITKEAWLTVGTHVAGLIVLMNHERAHVIASKAFGLVKKIF